VDAAQALADLTEISSQVVDAAIVASDGTALASTFEDEALVEPFLTALAQLSREADLQASLHGINEPLTQTEISTREGSVFVVRLGGYTIAATTRPDPTVGLVLYDLKRCLESLDQPGPGGREPLARSDEADAGARGTAAGRGVSGRGVQSRA
jgi:predicted regulator of Ras-like GTPase activity (Roadblock/LC7/MglB family)